MIANDNRISRRGMLATMAAGALGLAGCATAALKPRKKPNVVFFAVDDLNDWIQPLGGHPQALTPNLNRLAARGVNFTNAHCAAPACNPSRTALLTGLRPSTTGVYINPQPWRSHLPDAVTMPQYFTQQGYYSAACGKIFHGSYKEPSAWDSYVHRHWDPRPDNMPVNGIPNTGHFDWGPVDCTDEEMGDYSVVEWFREEIARDHDKPFFLAPGLFRPHLPWYAPRKYFDMFPPESIILPEVKDDDLDDVSDYAKKIGMWFDHKKVVETHNWRKAVSGYLACIAFTDHMIGLILDALDNSAYADDTIIMFWGDHGWHLGEKLHWRKFTLSEEATRCPLMVVAPGITKGGEKCARPVNLLDMFPTLIDLCGLDPKGDLEGTSFLPLLSDTDKAWHPTVTTYGWKNHSVRSDRYRYTRYQDGSEEMYDHQADPDEWTNLVGTPQGDAIRTRLAPYLPKSDAEPAPRDDGRTGTF